MLPLRRGNMRELDQPRSAQTCVVSITTLSFHFLSFPYRPLAWTDIDMNARTRWERRLERYVIVFPFRPPLSPRKEPTVSYPVHPEDTRQIFYRSKLAGSVSGPWHLVTGAFFFFTSLHRLRRLSKSGLYLIMLRFLQVPTPK
jgi:hypothetical protein